MKTNELNNFKLLLLKLNNAESIKLNPAIKKQNI